VNILIVLLTDASLVATVEDEVRMAAVWVALRCTTFVTGVTVTGTIYNTPLNFTITLYNYKCLLDR